MFKFFLKISSIIDYTNEKIGHSVLGLTIVLVCVQFIVVILRYIFGFNSTILQESIVWIYGIMVFTSASWTYILDRHVRVDILYQGFSVRKKALANIVGGIVLLLPLLIVLWVYSYPYVADSWMVLESSAETDGIPALFILKTFILMFIAQLFFQAISEIIKNINIYFTYKWN